MNFKYKSSLLPILAIVVFSFSSCYEEPDWLGDNVTTEGKHYPVIAGFNVLTEGEYFPEGTAVELDLDYWSLDEIASVKLYESIDGADPVEVATFTHADNFQADSQTDEMLMTYTIPSLTTDSIAIRLDAEVINVNGLTRNSVDGGTANRPSVTITAQKQ